MNSHTHRLEAAPDGDPAHRDAQEALPWLANGRLAGAELERVQAHVKACAACRAELALLHTLRAAVPVQDDHDVHDVLPGLDAERALARLLPQLDAPLPSAPESAAAQPTAAGTPAATLAATPAPVPLPPVRGWRATLAANDGRWLRAALALQCGAIAVLALLLARPADRADERAGAYRVLGAGTSAQGQLVVSFKPDTPERELRRIVLASGARVTGGPTVTGAWLLGTDEATATVAARLRADPAVTLAEPLGAEGQP